MRLTVGTRTRIVADLTFEFDPAAATVELEIDGDDVWHPATWVGPAVQASDGTWTRTAQSDDFFIGGESDGTAAIVLPVGRHFTTARVTLAGQPFLAPSTIIDVVAVTRFVTVDELRDKLRNAGGAGSRTAAELSDERLAVNLEEAVDEVLGVLTTRYTVPEDAAPPIIRTIVLGIAAYLATLEYYGSQPLEDRDPIVLGYARVQRLLADVGKGAIVVDELTPAAQGTATGDAAIFQGGPSTGLADVFLEPYAGHINTPAHFGGVTWE